MVGSYRQRNNGAGRRTTHKPYKQTLTPQGKHGRIDKRVFAKTLRAYYRKELTYNGNVDD